MTKRFTLLTASALCLITAFCLSGLLAREGAPSNWKMLEIRYAQADLELAMARLAQAESQNKLTSGTISQEMIDALKAGVKLTQDQLQQLTGKGSANPYAPQIAAAADIVKALENDHSESLQANKLQAGSVAEPQLRREQAEIEVAKARLAALQSLSQQPLEVRLDWEIHQLQDDIRALWARPLVQD